MTTNNIDPLSLPYVFLSEKDKLPQISAVYFAIAPSNKIIYIGSSSNLQKRWISHSRIKDFEDYRYIKIAWLEVGQERENLELFLINRFSPALNKRGVSSPSMQDFEQGSFVHLNKGFISGLIEGIANNNAFDIAIAVEIGLL